MPTPLWLGATGLLIAPSRGLLVYCPALVLIPLGAGALFRPRPERAPGWQRSLLISWLVAAAATVAFFAKWHDWRGGWCYGPRFLCEIMPICCLFFALAYASLPAARWRHFATALIGLSVAVQVVGVFGMSASRPWHRRHERHDQGRCLFELQDTQIEAHTRAFADRVASLLTTKPIEE